MTIQKIVYSARQHLQQTTGISTVKSTHIYELFAAAFGFKSYASLKTANVFRTGASHVPPPLDEQAIRQRILGLGYSQDTAHIVPALLSAFLRDHQLTVISIADVVLTLRGAQWTPADNFAAMRDDNDDQAEPRYSSYEIMGGEPDLVLLSCLESTAETGSAEAHYATALFYDALGSGYEDGVNGSEYWYLQAQSGRVLTGPEKEWAETYEWFHGIKVKIRDHLYEAARLGSQHALLDLADQFEEPAFFKQENPQIVEDPAVIARIAQDLGRYEDVHKWLTIAAEMGDTEAMRQLIEEHDAGNPQRCWVWFYLAGLCGNDLSRDDLYAIHEDGSLYDDDIGGNAFVDGRFGITLEPLNHGDDAAARLEAANLFSQMPIGSL